MTNEQVLNSIRRNPRARVLIVPEKKSLKDVLASYRREPEIVEPRTRSNAEILSSVIETYGGDNNGK